jgi:hypothetical protein
LKIKKLVIFYSRFFKNTVYQTSELTLRQVVKREKVIQKTGWIVAIYELMDDSAEKIQSAGSGSPNKRRLDQKTKRGKVKALKGFK